MYEENYSVSLLRLEEALFLVEDMLSSDTAHIDSKGKRFLYLEAILGEQFSIIHNETGSIFISALLSIKNLSESLCKDIPHPKLHQLNEILQHLAKVSRTGIDFQSAQLIDNSNNIVQLARMVPTSDSSLNNLLISAIRRGRELIIHIYEDFQRANAPTHN